MNKELMKQAGFGDKVKSVEQVFCPFCKEKVELTRYLIVDENDNEIASFKQESDRDFSFPATEELYECKLKKKNINGEFKNELSVKEFKISGICMACQVKTFG